MKGQTKFISQPTETPRLRDIRKSGMSKSIGTNDEGMEGGGMLGKSLNKQIGCITLQG